MQGVTHLLHRQRLSEHFGIANGGVIHIDLYLLAQQLAALSPHYGVFIHCHARVTGEEHKRVAHGLQVTAICSDVVIAIHLALNRVGIDVGGIYANGVTVHPQRVRLRVVYGNGTVGGIALTGLVVVYHIFAREHIPVRRIVIHHISVPLAISCFVIVIQTVSRDGLRSVIDGGASKELRTLRGGVIPAVLAMYDAVFLLYHRRACDVRP